MEKRIKGLCILFIKLLILINLVMFRENLLAKEKQLFMLLDRSRNPKYYSYSLDNILSEMKVDRFKLIHIGKGIQNKLGDD